MSISGALATAARSLELFSLGIQVAGNNIANAATPGYVREQLVTETSPPYRQGSVLIGTGSLATGVRQQLDRFLEHRIHTANTDFAAADVRNRTYQQLQNVLQELGTSDLSTSLNNFVAAANTVSNQPDDPASRSALIHQGQQFVNDATNLRQRIDVLASGQSDQLKSLSEEANSLIDSIVQLNPRISQVEANGLGRNEAGNLRVQRLNALDRLSQIIPIRVKELPSGAVDVYTDADYLVLDGHVQHLETVQAPTVSGVAAINVQLDGSHVLLGTGGGELGGAVQGRDQILIGFRNQLDQFVKGVIGEFNNLHAGGEGLIGFTDVTGTNAVADSAAALSSAGLPFTPQHGHFDIKVRNVQSGQDEVTTVPIDLDGIGADTSLQDLQTTLDAINHVDASITIDGRLRLTAESGYEIRFGDDTSGTLAALGINTFFTGSSTSDFGINSRLLQDQRLLATGRGGGPADNSNARALTQFIDQPAKTLNGLSVDQFYTNLIGATAQSASAETALANGFEGFRDSLKTQREQTSGVSLDDEAIQVMNLQHNYQAAARIVSTISELLDTLIRI